MSQGTKSGEEPKSTGKVCSHRERDREAAAVEDANDSDELEDDSPQSLEAEPLPVSTPPPPLPPPPPPAAVPLPTLELSAVPAEAAAGASSTRRVRSQRGSTAKSQSIPCFTPAPDRAQTDWTRARRGGPPPPLRSPRDTGRATGNETAGVVVGGGVTVTDDGEDDDKDEEDAEEEDSVTVAAPRDDEEDEDDDDREVDDDNDGDDDDDNDDDDDEGDENVVDEKSKGEDDGEDADDEDKESMRIDLSSTASALRPLAENFGATALALPPPPVIADSSSSSATVQSPSSFSCKAYVLKKKVGRCMGKTSACEDRKCREKNTKIAHVRVKCARKMHATGGFHPRRTLSSAALPSAPGTSCLLASSKRGAPSNSATFNNFAVVRKMEQGRGNFFGYVCCIVFYIQ